MLSRVERAVYLATALVVIAAILWPLVRDELDRAPLGSLAEPLALAPTAEISGAPFPSFGIDDVDINGVGPGSLTVVLAAGVYVASVYGDTTDLDVTMRTLDGRSTLTWGQTPYASFAVGDHVEASLYPGSTRIDVVPPMDTTRWGIRFERFAFPDPPARP
ncbi:MAG: hypothetical protein OXG43_11150 [Chloroflexi bacterium]|nr:hypothetical protein [Chloroflexota bacterium]